MVTFRLRSTIATLVFLVVAVPLLAQNAYVRTTKYNATPWADGGTAAGKPWATTTNYFEVIPTTTYQTIQGFGGCFCEMGWDDLEVLSAAGRDSVIRSLFDTSGCNFNFCRLPIGANDFSTNDSSGDKSYYSLDDVSGDNQITHLSLKRDSVRIIPFVKAAQAYKPNLRFWASPWTPPSWMKNNNNYYAVGGSGGASANSMKSDAQTLTAYALYLSKAVQAFKAIGINIEYITCQNEPDQNNHNYPTCGWGYPLELTFYKTYMIPRFQQDNLTTKILLGVYCCTSYADGITSFMNDATVKSWVGVTSHSWQDYNFGSQCYSAFPNIPFFETEGDWGQNAVHDWSEGINQFNSLVNFLTTGKAAVFTQWNMILDQTYSSHWAFAQSAPININTNTKVVDYQPHFWAMKHICHYVEAGAKAINLTVHGSNLSGKQAAFQNPNGDIVVVTSNLSGSTFAATIKVNSMMYQVNMPDNSINTVLISSGTAVHPGVALKTMGSALLSNARICNSVLYFTMSGAASAHEMDFTLSDLQGRTVWTGHLAGSSLQGAERPFAIGLTNSKITSGTYLLAVRIKNVTGEDAVVERKITAQN